MRIAVIGAGISGLTAAWLLHGPHEVTLFEAEERLGGHTHTVRVDTDHATHHLDTGFIVFNDRNYPRFERLLATLGVRSQPSEMSFSVSDRRDGLEYSSRSLDGLFADRRQALRPAFLRMVAEIPRFQRACRQLLQADDEQTSLRDWLALEGFSPAFVEQLIVPQVAAVWSADPRALWRFPAIFLARFFENHGMLELRGRPRWRTVAGGSATYVNALTAGFRDRIRVGSRVEAIRRHSDRVELSARGGSPEAFDHIVIATHSDQALRMLADATAQEREILGAIPYQRNEVVLHTDTRLLPRRRRAWASWNYLIPQQAATQTTVTYHLNRLQHLRSEQQFCVSLNLSARIDPSLVLRRIDSSHPVYTPEGVAAQRRVAEISGARRTHFCGAYWGWGFHEDGVRSGIRVAQELGVQT